MKRLSVMRPLPVPDRIVTDDEVSAARNAAAGVKIGS